MKRTATLAVRLQLRLRAQLDAALAGPRDRGDVPGWVMITLMTAAIVGLIWAVMGDTLVKMFSDAIDNIGPSGGGAKP